MVASRFAARLHQALQAELTIMNQLEGVGGVMTVCVSEKTSDADIIIIAVSAGNHLGFIEFCRS